MNRRFVWGLLLFNAVALPVLYSVSHPRFMKGTLPRSEEIAEYGALPDFELTREDGTAFGSAQMKGGYWIVDFIFTQCPNQCPMMSVKFGALQNDLPGDVRLASFSVDPANDTPERFKEYARNYGAKADRWVFLTGDAAILRRVREAAHLGNGEDPNMHSLRFVLLDKSLIVRGYYDSTDSASLVKLKQDLAHLKKR